MLKDLNTTISKLKIRQEKLITTFKCTRDNSKFQHYEIDMEIVEHKEVHKLEVSISERLQHLENWTVQIKQIQILFFDLENRLKIVDKKIFEETRDLNRNEYNFKKISKLWFLGFLCP